MSKKGNEHVLDFARPPTQGERINDLIAANSKLRTENKVLSERLWQASELMGVAAEKIKRLEGEIKALKESVNEPS